MSVTMRADPILEFFRAQVDPYIHLDIAAISDPHVQSFGFLVFNAHAAELWFKARGSGGGFTWTDKFLGSVGAGASRYFIAADMASRAKPTAPIDLQIELTVEAYSDAGYTNLLADAKYTIVVSFIDSTDGTWTIDDDDTFNVDQEGWSLTEGTTKGLVTDYYLSGPYALRFYGERGGGVGWFNTSIEKAVSIGVGAEAYVILNLKLWLYVYCEPIATYWAEGWLHGVEVLVNGARAMIFRDEIAYLRREAPPAGAVEWLSAFWYHIIVPLTPGVSNTVRVRVFGRGGGAGTGYGRVGAYFDNVRWIHK